MHLARAVRASAPRAPRAAVDGLEAVAAGLAALDTPLRAAHMIGQCAHESAGFTRRVESLTYRSGARIYAVFGRRHFTGIAHAERYARDPERLANHVYAGRMGNGDSASGDGFRFRGRGYIQLTGRANYRQFGARLGVDLERQPERAEDPEMAWLIAASYLAGRSRAGRTALQWADLDDAEMVTRIVNGGTNGLDDRRRRTARALAALGDAHALPVLGRGDAGPAVRRLQRLLVRAGFQPGAPDGRFGPLTEQALGACQAALGLPVTGIADSRTRQAIGR